MHKADHDCWINQQYRHMYIINTIKKKYNLNIVIFWHAKRETNLFE